MARIINLNKARKRKAKAEAEKRAEANRRLHGRTSAERARDELRKRQLESKLDGAFLMRPETESDDER